MFRKDKMIYKIFMFIFLALVCLDSAFKLAIDPLWIGLAAGVAAVALIAER